MEGLEVGLSYGVYLYPPSLSFRVRYQASEPQVFTVLRREFDHTLVRMAEERGAVSIKGRVRDLVVRENGVKLLLGSKAIVESKVVIGADGVNSIIANRSQLQPSLDKGDVALCLVKEVELGEDVVEENFGSERLLHVFLGFNHLHGYAWVFPKLEHLNIGLGGLLSRSRNIREDFLRFIQVLKRNRAIPRDFRASGYSAALIPNKGPIEKTFTDRVLLCGDAGGFVNPLTGEGIYYAMASGEIAAKTLTNVVTRDELGAHSLSDYQKYWMEDFGKELRIVTSLPKPFGRVARILESGVRLINTDERLLDMVVNACLGREAVDRSLLQRLLLRIPVSLYKYIFSKIGGMELNVL